MTESALKPQPDMNQQAEAATGTSTKVITGQLFRHRRSQGHTFEEKAPEPPPEPVRRPARVAVMLALAHKLQDAIDRGVVQDRAEVAKRLGLTRARVTQLMDLTLLAPEIQERVLFLEAVDGREPMSERGLREVVRLVGWGEQRIRAASESCM